MKKEVFRYEAVAEQVKRMIAGLALPAGAKVPSVRTVSGELGVSLSTVFQAYHLLEAQAVLVARPRSGYYVRAAPAHAPRTPPARLPAPAAVRIDDVATSLLHQSGQAGGLDFALLAPALATMPIARLNKGVLQALRQPGGESYRYPPVPGHPLLLRQVARHSFDWKTCVDPEQQLITNGGTEALHLCLQAVARPGDTVVLESPTHPGVLRSLQALGLRALELATDPHTGLHLELLAQALRQTPVAACLLMPRCSHPLGAQMPAAQVQRLVQLLAEHQVPLIEDDCLGELYFSGPRPLPAKAYDQQGLVLYCSSFSKTLTPGFRIGVVAAGRYHAQVARLKQVANITTAGALQAAIGHFMESGHYEAHLKKQRRYYQQQVGRYAAAVAAHFPAGTRVSQPAGGFSLWVELPPAVEALALQRQALQAGIGICPGPLLSTTGQFDHCIRLTCALPWSAKVDQALRLIGKLAKTLK